MFFLPGGLPNIASARFPEKAVKMAEKPIPSPESAKSLRAKFLQAALRRKSARGMYGANGTGINLEGPSPEQAQQLQLPAPKFSAHVQDAWEDHSAQIRNV